MPTDFDSIDETTSAADIAEALGSELFPEAVPTDKNPSASSPSAGGEREEVNPVLPEQRAETQKAADETPAVGAAPGEPAAPVSAPLPKAWKKELAPVWEAASPEIKAYVETREKAMLEGLSQYQQGHNAWGETISPFLPVLREHPDVNPVQLFQTLARNHLAILQAPPDQKLAIASRLLESYGIPLPSGGASDETPASELPAEFVQMRQELAQTRQTLQQLQHHNQSQEQARQQQVLASNEKVVADFFADPANPYAEEVGDDIARYLRADPAMGLPAAYRLACAANPVVQARILASQAKPAPVNGKPAPLNISDSGDAKPKPRQSKDWQAGVDEIVARSYSNSL